MSDFFIPTQNKDDYWTKKQQETQTTLPQQNTQNDYWGQRSQVLQQQKEERLANYNRYGVDVPDEYYEQFNKIISQVENPEQAQEEAYRIGSAIKYSQMYNMSLDEAYSKVDALNEANFTDLQDQKGRFEALSDMFNLGTNNVKLGQLGQQLMVANATGDTELAQNLMAQIDALNQQNVLMQDNTPRSWVMQALEAGAQSLPFTGYVAAAGIFGNFIAPGAGTGAAFAASSYLSAGQEYLDMLANGASHNTAAAVATVSGAIQGIIEADLGITNGIVKGTAKLMGKEAAEKAAKVSLEEIGKKVAKRFHFGAGKKVLVNYLEQYGKNVLGEGVEEFLQEITSIVGQEVAASLDGYDIPDDDFNSIVKQTTEAFKGGVLGALAMGFIPAGINAAADVKSYKFIKDTAEEYESGEMFKEAVKDSPVFEGMSDTQKADVIQEVWEKAQQRKEADVELEVRKIAETRDAAEGAEEMPEAEEGEETQAQSVARDESGRLYTNDDGNTFLVGDATKDDANRYGYIKYSTDDNGDITIDTFKMTEGREGLRKELFDEFAREHPDVNINWNAVGSEAQAMRQSLIDANPSGAKNGLNYYSSQDLDQVAARKKVAAEVRKNIHNVTKNADGTYTRTDLNNKQVAAAVTLIESAAKRMDMSLSDYVSKTFGNQIFGTREQFVSTTLAQGDTIEDKAGGMKQGVAQANWRQVGQQIKAVIYAGENADFSTWAHEMAHVFQNQLYGDLKTDAETAFNVVNGDWINSKYTFSDGRTMSSAEAFAYGFQDWLETGRAENQQMKNIFQKFAQFIADCYNKLRQHLNFTPEIESVFNRLLDGDDTIMSKALKAAQEEENEYRASLKRKAKEAENTKKAEAEEDQRQAELEKEEAGEYTDYEQETTQQSAEEIEAQLEEGNEKETGNAIDDALENLNISDEQKAQTAEVLKDKASTIAEKADAIVDAAGEQFDLFQRQERILNQIIGEPSVRRMVESEERERMLTDLATAKQMDQRFSNMDPERKASHIRRITGWEKNTSGQWKYETDDSVNLVKGGKLLEDWMRATPQMLIQLSKEKTLNLSDIYDAPELYKIFPYMKNVRVSFYSDPAGLKSAITSQGIKINIDGKYGVDGAKGLKASLVHEIQHIIQAMEYGENKALQGQDLEQLYYDMQDAIQAAGHNNNDFDITSFARGLKTYMETEGEIEARNVARRVIMNADQRRNTTLASTEDIKREQRILHQIIGEIGAQNLDNAEAQEGVSRMQDLVTAKQMDADNKNAKAIRLATSWEKGDDGKWKYEINDSYRYYDEKLKNTLSDAKSSNKKESVIKIKDIIDYPELFKAYPDIQDMDVIIKVSDNPYNATLGYYDQDEKTITLLYNDGASSQEFLELAPSTMLHEIQHVIQYKEGFAKGGNEGQFEDKVIDADPIRKKQRELSKKLNAFYDDVSKEEKKQIYDLAKTVEMDEWWNKKLEAMAKIHGNEVYELNDQINELQDQLDEIRENALEGQVEVDNKLYANTFEAYKSLAGEVESRNVQRRMFFTPQERLFTLLAATEDVAPEDKIILFQGIPDLQDAYEAQEKADELLKSQSYDGANNSNILYQKITDPELLEKLNSEPTIKVLRAMQVIDDGYYPPMATIVDGKRVEAAEVGDWLRSDENPDLAIPDIDKKTGKQKVDPKTGRLKWKFKLDKGMKDATGKKLTDIPAAYNPYWHTSRSSLNDQFSSAYKRPNLVTVEVEVPVSELSSGYWADRAKDPVGEMDWHTGPVSSKLAELGNPRKVILSRYCKIVRVIPDAEVASQIADMLKGTDIAIPDNTVSPGLLEELKKLGVKIEETEEVKEYNELLKEKGLLFQNTPEEIEAAETYLDTFKSAEKKRVKNNLEKFKDTSWYNVTIKSLNARSDINALLDAKELADDSILKHEAVKTYYEVLTAGDTKQERINNLYEYFDCKSSLIGNPTKPLNSVASSFINCNPSKECAQFCYAANGRNQMINLIVNRELVNWCIEHDPARSAKMVAEEYKVTREYKNGVALRLLDTGDLSAPWLDFIKELNDRGVSCQIFSKRPDLLKQVDREKNVILLSIDNSNTDVAKKYPDMPIAYVYSGVQDLEYIKNNEARFKKYNGVILPVVMNRKRLSPKEIDALPAWSKNYTCPIDAGWKEIGNNQERKYNKNKWNCSVCDINGQGCFFARAVKDRKKFYATLKEVPIGVLNAITEEYEKLAKSKLADLGLSESDIGSILTEMVNIRNQKLAGIDTEGTDTGLPGNGGILQEAPGETEGLGSQNGSQKESKVDTKNPDILFQMFSDPEEVFISKYPEYTKEQIIAAWENPDLMDEMDAARDKIENEYKALLNDPAFVALHIVKNESYGKQERYIHHSPRNDGNGKWQMSLFDNNGPYSHVTFDELDQASRRGYFIPDNPDKVEVIYDDEIRYDKPYFDALNNNDTAEAQRLAEEYAAKKGYTGKVDTEVTDATDIAIPLTKRFKNKWYTQEDYNAAGQDYSLLFQRVYHGSGANFDKFDTENYGLSGEGSMSFGYGTYVTDSEEIARDYATRQRNTYKPDANGDTTYNTLRTNVIKTIQTEKDKIGFEKALAERREMLQQQAEDPNGFFNDKQKENAKKLLAELENITEKDIQTRNLYTVEIPDNGYLQWDNTVSKDTRRKIVDGLYNKLIQEDYKGAEKELRQELTPIVETPLNGKEVYDNIWTYLGSDKEASQFLNSIGFTGIKYPAGTNYGNGNGAYNYVIFNDDDAKIIDHLLFQTNAELMQEAQGFDSWQDFMEFCEVMHSDDEVSPIPSEADAQWYQSFWETAHGLQTEQEKNEQAVKDKYEQEGNTPSTLDALFVVNMKQNPELLDDFLHEVARIDEIDLNSDEWRNVEDDMQAAERDKIDTWKDAISITMSDYNWQSAMRRIQGGGEISEGMRKRLLGEITDTMKSRDFRALYAEVMEDPQYAVDEADTTSAMLSKKLQKYQKRYYDIVKPGEDISKMSPEKRKRIAEAMANRDIANKIRNGSLKLDDELDSYIKSLDRQIKEKQKQFDELEKETKADYQRIADAEKRRLLKLHEELLIAKSKVTQKNSDTTRKINKGLKITEKYRRESQNLQANYDELFRKFNDLKNAIQITAEVQAALDRQEQVATVREDLNAKQKEKNLTAEVKKMRINLVKRTMRRVPFNRIDYDNAKTVIAIQRMLEPNLIGGVNKFIGIDSPFLRGVISQIVTDSDYKEKILRYLDKNSRSSEAFVNFKKKLTEMKSIKDFDSWTAKERKAAIKYLPKENWVKDLNLMELAKEREESIDLDIDTEEYSRQAYDENGKPKTYKDKEGIEHNVYETAFRLRYSDELGQLVKDAVGADMFDRIVNRPFSEWTTEELEQLAQRIDELYTEGRDLLAAKNEAKRREAEAIRKRVEDAIKDTGIVINEDDPPEEKERKQKEINKILNLNSGLKGTEAGKEKGIKAKLDRLIHGYSDMNVLRFARMLDNQSEGENVYMLYRREDECYNNKTRSINNRAKAINEIMKANKITEGDLAKSIPVPSLNTEFTVDELLYFLAADKDYAEDEKKLEQGFFGIDANDDYAATSRNAVMFGNMMSDTASQEQKEAWVEEDKAMEEAIANDTLTPEQKQVRELGEFISKPGTKKYIAYCHAKWETVLGAANSFIEQHPEYKALMEAIEADYAAQYERMNEVSINEFNMPVHRVKAYVPLVRRESNGDTNVNQVKEDLLGAYGADAGKQWVNKGMTQRRVQMNPLHQKPVQTGLFATWGSSVDRTEHFIAYAPYVRQLNAIYKSRDASYTRRFIESRYGKNAVKYLDDYINEVANPNAGKVREAGAEWLHTFRGRTAPAYLGWKFSAIIKQGLTSPWPYMQFVNPAEYASAALECTRKGTYDAIREKSVFMNNRVMDPMNELIEEMAEEGKTKFDRALGKFGKKGMAGLEWIDWVCVAPGWLACYKKEYARLQRASEARYDAKMEELRERNMYADIATSEYMTPDQMEAQARKEIMEDIEVEAVRYADDCTRQCQPSSRAADLAPLFKNSSEAMKAFLQFQTSLNVIWQNVRYDMPYAVRNKQFQRIVGTILGYVFAGIFMNSVMDGVTSGADDDDDKDLQALRNLVFYSTTQFTDAIPMIGSEVTNTMDQIITGKRGFMQSGTDMTPSATKLLSVLTNASKGNWEKAATLSAEAIGMAAGAPVSGLKEINKLLGKPLEEGDVNLLRGLSDVYGIAGDIIEE